VPSMHIGQPWQSDPRELAMREFQGTPEDFEALARVRNETLRATTLPEDFQEKTAQEMDRYYNRADFNLVSNSWLLFHADEPVGAAVVYPTALFHDRAPGNFDMYVVPQLARHGLGTRLLSHLERAAAERGYPVLETTIAAEDERSTRFLRERDFKVVGQSSHLTRLDMDGLPQCEIPQGYSIRSLAELNETPELYRETTNRLGAYDPNYSLVRPEEIESAISSETWEPAGILFLFDPATRIVGVIRASGAASGRGYLREIRLEPASRGKGLGTAMLAAALQYLSSAGAQHAALDTTGDDTAAHNLAVRAGFQVVRHWLHFIKLLRET
jgi:GNAT superfamily N-acetyltransferase